MGTRLLLPIFAAWVITTMTADAATVKTRNFIVKTASQDDAEEFARLAEYYRKQKAIEWLGREMPPWSQPCELVVQITRDGAGGATTFDFDGNEPVQSMQIEGNREKLKNSVLPHEVTHTVFAWYFRRPVPRWADEGGSVLSENAEEWNLHDKLCRQYLNSGKAIQLSALFSFKEYPNDRMALYAQGYSVTRFLVEKSDRAAFLKFVAAGQRNGWDEAVKVHYGYKNVDDLQRDWIEYLKRGGGRGEIAKGTSTPSAAPSSPSASTAVIPTGSSRPAPVAASVTYDSSLPGRPMLDPAPTSRALAPSGSGMEERTSGDIGWTRPRAKLGEPMPVSRSREIEPIVPTASTSQTGAKSPRALLLPPEPLPFR